MALGVPRDRLHMGGTGAQTDLALPPACPQDWELWQGGEVTVEVIDGSSVGGFMWDHSRQQDLDLLRVTRTSLMHACFPVQANPNAFSHRYY